MDKRELELLHIGKRVEEHQTLQMSPYPVTIAFITSQDEWDGFMKYIHHLDPDSEAIEFVGELQRKGPSSVYFEYDNVCVYAMGMQTYDPSYTVDYYRMLIGAFARLVQAMIMDYADRIGHEVQPSANPSGAIIDWALQQWTMVLNNRYNGLSSMLSQNDFRLCAKEPKLMSAVFNAYGTIGATAINNALQRECHALLNHVVTPNDTGWQATTYFTGGNK